MIDVTRMSCRIARHALAVALAVALPATASFALGSEDQRAACTPDVFRLCSSEIPNVDRIVACLRKEKTNLSAGCQAVFDHTTTASATRSIEAPVNDWCSFGRTIDPSQADWLKWCNSATPRP